MNKKIKILLKLITKSKQKWLDFLSVLFAEFYLFETKFLGNGQKIRLRVIEVVYDEDIVLTLKDSNLKEILQEGIKNKFINADSLKTFEDPNNKGRRLSCIIYFQLYIFYSAI